MNFHVNSKQITLFEQYLAYFYKWNKTYNLSAIRDREGIVNKHLLDSLSVVEHLSQVSHIERVADIGTGGGLPGIPLAICFPHIQFTLVDSAGKKMRFLHQVKQSLNLDNVQLQNSRVEDYQPPRKFDIVISRAFASIADMARWCDHLIDENGQFWAMKGQFPQDEFLTLEKNLRVEDNHTLDVPAELGARCLVIIRKT